MAICGIDLGTTYSAISWFDVANNRVMTIDLESADGGNILRSAIFYPGPGDPIVVGETAWNAARSSPDRVITGIKRSMGTSYRTPAIDGAEYSPPQVSAEILKALVRDAETYLGEPVTDVVITVPAHFGDSERAATLEAGQLAGLNVIGLLAEPFAAALAYAVEQAAKIQDKYLLVYDLGGGTFDVTLIHTMQGSDGKPDVSIIAKDGASHLGGMDWDRILASLVMEKVLDQHGVDLHLDIANEPLLLDNCEKAKRHLSNTGKVSIIADIANHQVEVNVDEFEDVTQDLLSRTEVFIDNVLDEAEQQHGITRDKIEVMLAGGSTKMPMVRKMLTRKMGREPMKYRNPELLVTIGAAYWSHLLTAGGTTATGDISLYGVGVEAIRQNDQGKYVRYNSIMLPKGTVFGSTPKSEDFGTTADDMTEIDIVLYRGDTEDLSQCSELLRVAISGLPDGRIAGENPITLTLGYDSNGMLFGEAIDVDTNNKVDIELDRSAMLG